MYKDFDDKKCGIFTTNRDDYIKSFRDNIEIYAKSEGLTLKQISEKADIPFSTLNSFLYGTQRDCKLSTAVKLARAIGISVDQLVGCETVPAYDINLINQLRKVPERTAYLARWYVNSQYRRTLLNNREKTLTVMIPDYKENSGLYPSTNFVQMDITDLSADIKSKVHLGMKLLCDYYMPIYSPFDTLLIANDRPPKNNENSVVTYQGKIFIVRRKVDDGVAKYMSIRDGKFRMYENELDNILGYIADIYYE